MAFPSRAARVSAVLSLLLCVGALAATAKTATLVVTDTPDMLVYPGACRDVDAMDADAQGDAVGLIVRYDGKDLIGPYSAVNKYQNGPGMSDDDKDLFNVSIPGLVSAKVLHSRVDLKVDRDPLEAQAWSQTTVLELNILNGTITADTIKAFAYADADIHHAYTKTTPSTIQGLHVGSLSVTDVAPGAQLKIPDVGLVGPASFVKTYVREDHSKFPGNGSILYKGNTTVTMLHVFLADVDPLTAGFQSLEVIVSQAHAYAQSPTPFCGLVQSVEAGAYVARVRTETLNESSLLVGEQHIGVVGGKGKQQVLGQEVVAGPSSLLETNVSETRVNGTVFPNDHSESHAVSKVLGLCISQDGTVTNKSDPSFAEDYGSCFISATAIRAESDSYADADHAISWGSVTIVGLKVAGVDVCADILGMPDDSNKTADDNTTTSPNICKPAMNTNYDLGLVNITFNQRERDEARPGHTGLFVRAMRIQAPGLFDIIVGRAFTAADYLDPSMQGAAAT